APTATRWRPTTTRSLARPSSLSAAAKAASSSAAKPTKTSSDSTNERVPEDSLGAVAADHAVDAAAGVGGGRAEVEAADRRRVPEPAGDRTEHQLLVEGVGPAAEVAVDEIGVGGLEVLRRVHGLADDAATQAGR